MRYKEVKSLTQDLIGFKPKQSGSRKHTLTHYDTLPPDQGSALFFFFATEGQIISISVFPGLMVSVITTHLC